MSDKKPTKFFRTCKNCGYDNSDTASKCNSCAKSLTGGFSDKYHSRWGCPDCGTLNMKENSKCAGCDYKVPGCFLTTACVEFAGMADNCEDLTLMRKLRDDYVARLPDSEKLISEYYEVSPKIVSKLNQMPEADAAKHYEQMLGQIRIISLMVKNESYSEAKDAYFTMYDKLKRLL